MSSPSKAAVLTKAAELKEQFVSGGAIAVEMDVLLPADVLLDLYGEDIRARAYVTADPLQGEMMLRPDFTVPVVQAHMREGNEPARYTYAGEVFRKQNARTGRPHEFMQVGYEVFDRSAPEEAEAEVFARFHDLLAPLNLRASTGDIGVLVAAIQGLQTSNARRAALLRHIWRPRRFRALLTRFSKAGTADREKTLARVMNTAKSEEAPFIGLRTQSEIDARMAALKADAAEAPISEEEIELLSDILSLKETLPNVISALSSFAVDMPQLETALERLKRRADAVSTQGLPVDDLEFEASYGRTSMEYYDGFVFGFYAPNRPDLPPIASGGRYDALTKVLSQDNAGIPAVGGVLRPALMLDVEARS